MSDTVLPFEQINLQRIHIMILHTFASLFISSSCSFLNFPGVPASPSAILSGHTRKSCIPCRRILKFSRVEISNPSAIRRSDEQFTGHELDFDRIYMYFNYAILYVK